MTSRQMPRFNSASNYDLRESILSNDFEGVKKALENKANPNTKFEGWSAWSGCSVLSYCVFYNKTKFVNLLLKSGATPQDKMESLSIFFKRWRGVSLLGYSLHYHYYDTALSLLKYGANPSQTDIKLLKNLYGVSSDSLLNLLYPIVKHSPLYDDSYSRNIMSIMFYAMLPINILVGILWTAKHSIEFSLKSKP